MRTVEGIRAGQRTNGPATILAIGTANPSNCVAQDTFTDYYFRVTESEHMTELKNKFKVICEKSDIKQRYMHLTEEMVKQNPSWISHTQPSLRSRNAITSELVSKLGKEAAEKAMAEWGQPRSKITHLIFCTNSNFDMPGPDCRLRTLLALDPSVERFFLCSQGCAGGVTSLRLAKDLAENNPGARVLVVCSEVFIMPFRGPSGGHLGNVVGQALFGDGAAAVIVGSDPVVGVERPLFQMAAAMQTLLPNSGKIVRAQLKEVGIYMDIGKEVPTLVSENIEKCLKEGFDSLGISDWNSIFWMAHPAGRAVLDKIEDKLSLKPEKLRASRKVLSDYGNMMSPTCLFVMDEMRKYSAIEGLRSTGEGLDWGVLCAYGPGLAFETIVLCSSPTHPN